VIGRVYYVGRVPYRVAAAGAVRGEYVLDELGGPRSTIRSLHGLRRASDSTVVARPVRVLGWELRKLMALRRRVRVTLSDRCDGVLPREDGRRVLEGYVTSVSPTDAFAIVVGRHVPLDEILALHKPHFSQGRASDPRDPLGAAIAR
jgi:hypothetical protein